jgi:hypothetical protein
LGKKRVFRSGFLFSERGEMTGKRGEFFVADLPSGRSAAKRMGHIVEKPEGSKMHKHSVRDVERSGLASVGWLVRRNESQFILGKGPSVSLEWRDWKLPV